MDNFYVGSTANTIKTRINGYCNDVKKLLDRKNNYSKRFSRQFKKIYKEKYSTDTHDINKLKSFFKFKILQAVKPLDNVGLLEHMNMSLFRRKTNYFIQF